MKTSFKIAAAIVGFTVIAGFYLTYQSSWGQSHLKKSKVGDTVISAYQATEEFATEKAADMIDYFTKK